MAAHPHAFLLRQGDLVPDLFPGYLTLELGEGEEDVQREPPHGGGGVELLGDRDEGDAVPVEQVDDLGEVAQGTAEPKSDR